MSNKLFKIFILKATGMVAQRAKLSLVTLAAPSGVLIRDTVLVLPVQLPVDVPGKQPVIP